MLNKLLNACTYAKYALKRIIYKRVYVYIIVFQLLSKLCIMSFEFNN